MSELDPEDRERFEQLVLPHVDAAFNLARWLLRRREDAEDVAQEALLRACRFIRGFHELGYKDISLDKAIQLVDHGVSVSFVREFKGLGFSDLTLSKAVELQDHGVTARAGARP